MISSINNDSSYSSLKTINNLFNKLNSTTETNKQSAYEKVEATVMNGSKNTSNDDSSTDNSVLSFEDYLQMMQSFQKAVDISTSSSEQTASSSEQNTTVGDISSIDTDEDGTISADEYDSLISQMGIKDAQSSEDFFAQFDTDGDGEITASEMDASKPMRPMGPPPQENESLLSKMDTDKDGTISTDEYNFMQSLSEELRRLASNTLNAYESNYQFMFGIDNTNYSSNSI